MSRFSDSSAVLSGILFLVMASIVAAGGLMWRNFLEFSAGATPDAEVFGQLATQPAVLPPEAASAGKPLVFGFVVPRGDLVKFIEAIQPPLNGILQRIGFRATIDVSDSTAEMLEKLEKDRVQVCAVTAVSYAKLRRGGKIRAILERTGKSAKHSLFLVREDSPIQGLEDLKGKKIAYKARDSMSGYTMPLIEMKHRGIDPATFFGTETFTGNARSSVLGVISGEFDCAVVSNTFFDELEPGVRAVLRVILKSGAVPGGVYVASSDRNRELIDRVGRTFLAARASLHETEEFSGYLTVKEPDPTMYDFLDEAAEDDDS